MYYISHHTYHIQIQNCPTNQEDSLFKPPQLCLPAQSLHIYYHTYIHLTISNYHLYTRFAWRSLLFSGHATCFFFCCANSSIYYSNRNTMLRWTTISKRNITVLFFFCKQLSNNSSGETWLDLMSICICIVISFLQQYFLHALLLYEYLFALFLYHFLAYAIMS